MKLFPPDAVYDDLINIAVRQRWQRQRRLWLWHGIEAEAGTEGREDRKTRRRRGREGAEGGGTLLPNRIEGGILQGQPTAGLNMERSGRRAGD